MCIRLHDGCQYDGEPMWIHGIAPQYFLLIWLLAPKFIYLPWEYVACVCLMGTFKVGIPFGGLFETADWRHFMFDAPKITKAPAGILSTWSGSQRRGERQVSCWFTAKDNLVSQHMYQWKDSHQSMASGDKWPALWALSGVSSSLVIGVIWGQLSRIQWYFCSENGQTGKHMAPVSGMARKSVQPVWYMHFLI